LRLRKESLAILPNKKKRSGVREGTGKTGDRKKSAISCSGKKKPRAGWLERARKILALVREKKEGKKDRKKGREEGTPTGKRNGTTSGEGEKVG